MLERKKGICLFKSHKLLMEILMKTCDCIPSVCFRLKLKASKSDKRHHCTDDTRTERENSAIPATKSKYPVLRKQILCLSSDRFRKRGIKLFSPWALPTLWFYFWEFGTVKEKNRTCLMSGTSNNSLMLALLLQNQSTVFSREDWVSD